MERYNREIQIEQIEREKRENERKIAGELQSLSFTAVHTRSAKRRQSVTLISLRLQYPTHFTFDTKWQSSDVFLWNTSVSDPKRSVANTESRATMMEIQMKIVLSIKNTWHSLSHCLKALSNTDNRDRRTERHRDTRRQTEVQRGEKISGRKSLGWRDACWLDTGGVLSVVHTILPTTCYLHHTARSRSRLTVQFS